MSRLSAVLICVCLLAAALPAFARDGQVPTPNTATYATPIVITVPGSYVVTRNLTPTGPGPIIAINVPNLPGGDVVLDLNGHLLDNQPNATDPVIDVVVAGSSEVAIRNGSPVGGSSDINAQGPSRKLVVEDVTIGDFTGTGIGLAGIYTLDVENVAIRRCVIHDALGTTGGPPAGIYLDGGLPRSGVIEDNIIRRTYDGIVVLAGNGFRIANNQLLEIQSGMFGSGIHAGLPAYALEISHNVIDDVLGPGLPSTGMRFQDLDGSKVYNNVVKRADEHGIYLDSNCEDNLILDNVVSESDQDGLRVKGSRNHTNGNVLNFNGRSGTGWASTSPARRPSTTTSAGTRRWRTQAVRAHPAPPGPPISATTMAPSPVLRTTRPVTTRCRALPVPSDAEMRVPQRGRKHAMKRLMLLLGALALVGPPTVALDFYVAPGVPVDLTGVGTALPWNVTRHNTPFTYTTTLPFPLVVPFSTHVDGLYLTSTGDWLFSVENPTDIAETTYLPEDVVRFDTASSYTTEFCGNALGIPSGANVDALFQRAQRDDTSLIVSFDVPTTLGGTTYEPTDLVEFKRTSPGCNGWTLSGPYFDASAATPPIPTATDVTGADEYGDPLVGTVTLVLTFDVPTTLGTTTYVPGELVEWNAAAGIFSSLHKDASWSISARANGLALLAAAGSIVPPGLLLSKAGGGQITFDWTACPSCSTGVEDYGIYEGSIGTWYSHNTALTCTDTGANLQETLTPGSGNNYYLVVPNTRNADGSHGRDSSGTQRPQGSSPCRPRVEIGCP